MDPLEVGEGYGQNPVQKRKHGVWDKPVPSTYFPQGLHKKGWESQGSAHFEPDLFAALISKRYVG